VNNKILSGTVFVKHNIQALKAIFFDYSFYKEGANLSLIYFGDSYNIIEKVSIY